MNRSKIIFPSIISAILLILAIPSGLPYGYYTFMRWFVCIAAIYLSWVAYDEFKQPGWLAAYVPIAILFNPLTPVYLDKSVWVLLDLMVGVIFVVGAILIKGKESTREKKNESN